MPNFEQLIPKIKEKKSEKVISQQEIKEEKIREDFRKACLLLLGELEKQIETAKEGYVFSYGSQMGETSHGKKVLIDNISWFDRQSISEDDRQRLALIARDPNSMRIIGLRLSDIKEGDLKKKGEDDYVRNVDVAGEIITRYRGEGLSTVLENTFLEVLTKVASEYKQKYPGSHQFNWKVENRNLKRIEELKNNGLGKNVTAEDIKEKEEEQKRWQALYGEGGKFGLNKIDDYHYSKTIDSGRASTKEDLAKPIDFDKFQEIIELLKEFNN